MENMRILITGATGALGYDTYLYLKSLGFNNILCTGRTIKKHQKFDKNEFISLDLSILSSDEYFNFFGNIDVIIHCAALASDNDRWGNYYLHNVNVTKKLRNYGNIIGCKNFIYISSPSLYFNNANNFLVNENALVQSAKISLYAKSKYESEECLLKNNNIFHTTILRPRAIFGEHDTILLPKINNLIKKKNIFLVRKGRVEQDFTYVRNVSHAIYCALKNKHDDKSIYNITNHEPYYLDTILYRIAKKNNINLKINNLPVFFIDIVNFIEKCMYYLFLNKKMTITKHSLGSISYDMILDNSAAISKIKYKPIVDMNTALNKVLQDV